MLFKRKNLLDMYQQAFNGAETAIWDWRPGKPEIRITPEWWDLTGVPAGTDSIDFAAWFDGIHIDDQKSVKECLYRHDLNRSESCRFEYRYKNKNGEIIWLLFNGRINHGYDGQLKRVIGLVTNITEHKRFSEETGFLAYNDSLTKLPNKPGSGESHYSEPLMGTLIRQFRKEAQTVWGLVQAMTWWSTHGETRAGSSGIMTNIGREARVATAIRSPRMEGLIAA